jgi:hypothetical protein
MSFLTTKWGGRLLGALVVVVAGGYTLYKQWPDTKHQLKGYSFAEVLPETAKSLGPDARVVAIYTRGSGRDGEISFSVLRPDGRVHVRFYGDVCTPGSRGSNCSIRRLDSDRRATGRDRDLAVLRLGDIAPDAPDRVRRESGAADVTAIGLRGRHWVAGAPTAYIADPDGSNGHRPRTAEEAALAVDVASTTSPRR